MVKALIIEQNFLNYKCRHCLTQLCTSLHDSEAQRYDFRLKQETDNLRIVNFNECAYDAQRCQSEVLETSSFANSV